MAAIITYNDNTTEYHYVSFNTYYTGWQYTSAPIVPKEGSKTVTSIKIRLAYYYCSNKVWFDDVSLTMEPVQT